MLHIDIKRLGRRNHRVTGNRRHTFGGAGWEYLFVAIDDHARIGFTDMYPDDAKGSTVQSLHNPVSRCYQSLGVKIQRLLTDNGRGLSSKDFAKALRQAENQT